MKNTRKIKLLIEVESPKYLTQKRVAELVDNLIASGLEDAESTSRLPDYENPDVEQVLALEIGDTKVVRGS